MGNHSLIINTCQPNFRSFRDVLTMSHECMKFDESVCLIEIMNQYYEVYQVIILFYYYKLCNIIHITYGILFKLAYKLHVSLYR